MKINFTQILQDSWNFVRNQSRVVWALVGVLLVVQLVGDLFSVNLPQGATAQEVREMLNQSEQVYFGAGSLIKQLLFVFATTFSLACIHFISQPSIWAKSFQLAARKIIGVLILDVLILLPLTLSLVQAYINLGSANVSLFLLLAMAVGIFIFVRLNLVSVHYLINNVGILQSLRQIWQLGMKRNLILFGYTVIVYFTVPILSASLIALAGNTIMNSLLAVIISFLNVFALIFTYRFYTLFKG